MTTAPKKSFAADIEPIFRPFVSYMSWRLNLGSYDHVKTNAQIILNRITEPDNPMPPSPFTPLTANQIATFKQWMDDGCPP